MLIFASFSRKQPITMRIETSKRSRFLAILTLGLLSAIGPFSIDMYLPSFKDIADSMDTTISQVTLSLSSYFVGVSLGQLIYGPLLDRYGRKIPLYVGMILYLATSIYCSFITDIDTLILARFFQALGGCAGMVTARALVRDVFPVEENAKIFSMLMLVIAVSPIIAPTLGGYISSTFGWEAIFISLAIIALFILLAMYFWLPDGNPPNTELSLMPKPIIKEFLAVAKVPQFYTFAITGSLAASGLYSYIAGSPYLFMEVYEVSEKQYGWIFAIIAGGLILASQVNTFLLNRYGSERIIYITLICQVSTGILLVTFTYFDLLNLYTTIALIWIYLATQGFVFPNTSALALAPFARNAGTASALMGAVQLGFGALATAAVSALSNNTAMPMTGVMLLCCTSAFAVFLIGSKSIHKRKPRKTS